MNNIQHKECDISSILNAHDAKIMMKSKPMPSTTKFSKCNEVFFAVLLQL